MSQVSIHKVNETYLKITCDPGIAQELSDSFSFEAPNAKFDKRVRKGIWDGRIRLYNLKSNYIYVGLKTEVIEFCEKHNYTWEDHSADKHLKKITVDEFITFTKTLNLPEDRIPYDFQIQACVDTINNEGRQIILSPTSSGKSLIIYLLIRWYEGKALIVVPTTTLVLQMAGDFKEYNYTKDIHQIKAGVEKTTITDITTSTWHSIYTLPASYFNQFDVIIVDEVHGATAKSLKELTESATKVSVKIGLTGTIEDTKCDKLVLQGLFGRIVRATTTRELMDRGITSDLNIIAIDLKYPDEMCKQVKKQKLDYPDEIKTLIGDKDSEGIKKRQYFIAKLAATRKGNTLVLFRYIEHGKNLLAIVEKICDNSNKKIFLVYGKTPTEDRNVIRSILENNDDCIIIATYKTLGTGINIKNLHNLIFTSPVKGMITVLQSIGRSLRLHKSKTKAVLYDIGDNLCSGKYINFAYKHFVGRLEYYTREQFNFKVEKVKI